MGLTPRGRRPMRVTPPRTIYVEDDRGALYQHQAGFWQYVAGTMWGTFSPDQRPTDLGTHDAGFTFRTTDSPPREFVWSQTAWIETTPPGANSAQIAQASGNVTLTTAAADIPGCSLTLPRSGTYLIVGVFDCRGGSGVGDAGSLILGYLVANGAAQAQLGLFTISNTATVSSGGTVAQQWLYTASSAGQIVKLQAAKTGGTGGSFTGNHSTISATWISP